MSDAACLAEDELCALAEGTATERARARAEEHLDGCDDCRRVLAALAHEERSPDDETPTVPAQRLGVTLPVELASRYVLLREMGDNALYVAYVARDRKSDELVGFKWIRQEWSRDPGMAARIRAAVTRARAIQCENVVRMRDAHEVGGAVAVVEDLVASDDLAALLRARGIGPELAFDVVLQLLGALANAHGAGVPHGHLRTENVLVDLAGHVHVADFGLANAVQGRALTHAEQMLDDVGTASRLSLTLLERCGGGVPAVVGLLEGAVENPGRYPSAVALAEAVERVQLERRADVRSAGRDRDWMPSTGQTIAGKYLVEGLLGRGGMAAVVTARNLATGERVAIKLMPPRATKSRAAVERFLREGHAAASVSSEHVVKMIEVGQSEEGAPFIVMEHLEGETLGRLLRRRGALPVIEALHYVLQACIAVAECHAVGIVHRDLKPENIMVLGEPGPGATVKVLDFGVSKSDWLEQAARFRLTGTADVLGTPTHMSPEQVRSAKSVDARTDIWALGVILYEAVTGVPPFIAENLPALCAAIVSDDPRPPRELRTDLPPAIESVILQCLQKHPDARPFSVRSLAEMIAPYLGETGRRAVEKIRGVAEASVPRISSLPPPPRPSRPPPPPPAPPPPPPLSVAPEPQKLRVTDTGAFLKQVSPRKQNAGAALVLVVCVFLLIALVIGSLDDETEATTARPAASAAPTQRRSILDDLEDPSPMPAGSADAGGGPVRKRPGGPAANPLDTRF